VIQHVEKASTQTARDIQANFSDIGLSPVVNLKKVEPRFRFVLIDNQCKRYASAKRASNASLNAAHFGQGGRD
jgi:hypothetical protein